MKNNDEEFIIEQIRTKYTQKEDSKLDKLKALDKKAGQTATNFALSFGIIAILIFGTGMCLAMKVIGDNMTLGVIIGVLGMILCVANYPLYNLILSSSRKKYAPEILRLSDELLKNK